MSNIIDALNWRYATKIFDKNKKVTKTDLDDIIEAFRLTASSYWLQAWKLLVIENQEIKNSLLEASWGQKQVSDCSQLLVLCRVSNVDKIHVWKFIDSISETRWINRENLTWFEDIIMWTIQRIWAEWNTVWHSHQLYIALWNLLTVLALMKIDSCPMEWIIKEKYDDILSLDKKWLNTVVVLPIWYRSDEDKYSSLKKVRFNREEVVEII